MFLWCCPVEMGSVFVLEARRNELCFCGGVLVESALFLWWRPGGISSVSVVEAGGMSSDSVVEAWWNEHCFCGGDQME
jgi:hypothetical protein